MQSRGVSRLPRGPPTANDEFFFTCDPPPVNASPWDNRIRRIAWDYQLSAAPRGKCYEHIATDFIHSYKADVVGCRSKTAEYCNVDIAVMSCHVVQLQGLANAAGCSTANHTHMQFLRTAPLLSGSYTVSEPSAITVRCDRPEYTGCLAKKGKNERQNVREMLLRSCAVYILSWQP